MVAAGASTTFTLTGFSTAPIPPWSLTAFAGYGTFVPTLQLSTSTIGNGQTAPIKVTVPSTATSQSYASVFVSSSRGPNDFNYWPVAVAVPRAHQGDAAAADALTHASISSRDALSKGVLGASST
jgi:hypothetical protein